MGERSEISREANEVRCPSEHVLAASCVGEGRVCNKECRLIDGAARSINEFQACLGNKLWESSRQINHLIGTSAHAPQCPRFSLTSSTLGVFCGTRAQTHDTLDICPRQPLGYQGQLKDIKSSSWYGSLESGRSSFGQGTKFLGSSGCFEVDVNEAINRNHKKKRLEEESN
ncbi:hypothetical protein TNCV_3934471 [Trichonephila clavipes]|nr:hypothetical protein TNCV_3934471 [Trichonephila clavipes]